MGQQIRSRSNGRFHAWRSGSGFTLIELLVVISIITLLIAMLLPAIKRAKEHARIVHCSSNLRQLGMAVYAYSVDNYDMMPGYNHGKNWSIMPVIRTSTVPIRTPAFGSIGT